MRFDLSINHYEMLAEVTIDVYTKINPAAEL